jgi:hypothetical protein
MDETKVTGALPNVEITHRQAPDGSAEFLTINLTATPDFRTALPLAGAFAQMPLMMGALHSPLQLWTQTAQAMLTPWTQLLRANPLAAPMIDAFLSEYKK